MDAFQLSNSCTAWSHGYPYPMNPTTGAAPHHRASTEPGRWDGVAVMPYKEDGGTHFKSISRQLLYPGGHDLNLELRYFEIAEGGHSTLERHDHAHLVVVIQGCGQVMVKDQIHDLKMHDVVHVPPQTWHQFQANQGEGLGFLCLVNPERDRPHRPETSELEAIREATGEFVKV